MCPLYLPPKSDHLILEAYQDFILSRNAALLSPRTIEFYEYTVGEFIEWLSSQGLTKIENIASFRVRAHITSISDRGVSNSPVHSHARGTRTFLRFLNEEGYIPAPIYVEMPRVVQKQMRVLPPNELNQI